MSSYPRAPPPPPPPMVLPALSLPPPPPSAAPPPPLPPLRSSPPSMMGGGGDAPGGGYMMEGGRAMPPLPALPPLGPITGAAASGKGTLHLKLRKFDMARVRDDAVVVFIGKRNTGKSFLIRDLLWHKREFPIGTVISATEGANGFYGKMVPSLFIHEEFNTKILDNVIKRQTIVAHHANREVAATGRTTIDKRAFIIMDDCMFDSKFTSDRNVRFLFMNGRHSSLLYLLSLQYVMGIPPVLRGNVDYVFLLRETNVQNRKRIYEQYAGVFPTFQVFCNVMDACTHDCELLVIDNTVSSNKLEDMVFWYRPSPRPDFRIGAPEYWARSTEREREEAASPPDAAAGG